MAQQSHLAETERVPIPVSPEVVDDFRHSMRRLAATVCIITASTPDGPIGMTMTSVTSVSMDPPTLLICVNRNTRLSSILEVGKDFCVNLLRSNQQEEASAFSGKLSPEERFSVGRWTIEDTRPPRLEKSQANIFCTVESLSNVGTHFVLFGRVCDVLTYGEVEPLLYTDGRYVSLGAGSVGF